MEALQECQISQNRKIKTEPEERRQKQWRYNGWVKFFGSVDCSRAKRLIETKKQKFGNMKIEKVGNVKCIGFDYKKKFIVSPLIRFKAKKEDPRQISSWGHHWSPKNDSRFAEDFFDGLLSNGVVLVELSCVLYCSLLFCLVVLVDRLRIFLN